VSAIVAHPASGENVGVSWERRKSCAAAQERAEAFSLPATTTASSEARAARKSAYQTIGGALIPRMPSRPVEEVP
jgi:hypothetical protein